MILLSTIVTSMQKELGSFFATEAHPDMYRYINSAVNYLYNYRDWDWNKKVYSFVYNSPDTEQTLPFYPMKVFWVKLGGKIQYIYDSETWFIMEDHTDAVGFFADKVISSAAGTYQMMYAKSAPSYTAADTEIDIPAYYQDVLQSIAIHYAYKDIKDYQTASGLIGAANAILNNVTDRSVNIHPRNTIRLGSNYTF